MILSDGEILVSLEHGSSAIVGTVRVADGPATPFEGWLGLMSALRVAAEAVGAGSKEPAGADSTADLEPA